MQSHDGTVQTVWDCTRLTATLIESSTVACMHVLQVLDKAFMSGVLLMTAFWSVAAVREQPGPSHKSHSVTATSAPAATARSAATASLAATARSAATATASDATAGATAVRSAATATAPAASAGPTAARPAAAAAAPAPTATGATGTQAELGGTNPDLAATTATPTAGADSPATAAAAAQESTMPVRVSDVQDSSSNSSSSLIAAELLDNLSYLQFCRMKLTAYNALLKNVLSSVSTSRQVGVYSSHCLQHP